jgi:C_GCAxxG_C_C family probable redox protein
VKELIDSRVHGYYWGQDYNCAVTTLKVLSEIFSIEIHPQVVDSAIGMHGAGGFGAQCGLVEGSLLFIGILGNDKGMRGDRIVALCHEFASAFQQQFGSIQCKELRPQGFGPENPPHLCEAKTAMAIKFSAEYIGGKILSSNG